MKRIFAIFLSLTLGSSVFAAPRPTFINAGVITNAIQIDAVNFLNLGTFTNLFTTLPYDTQNTVNFTNRGVMSGSVGFHFDTIDSTLNTRRPLINFDNRGTISAVDNGASFFGFGLGTGLFLGSSSGTASYALISATNLINRGNISVGTVGLMRLNGKNVDLSRGSLVAGTASNSETNIFLNNFFNGSVSRGFFLGNSYVNAFGVEDLYWGAGPFSVNLESGNFGYFPPNGVFTPSHAVQTRPTVFGTTFTLLQSLPTTFPADFEAHANVTEYEFTDVGINKEIQVVFVKTNMSDTNISTAVRFSPSIGFTPNFSDPFGQLAIVEFSVPELDPISGQTITNAVYLLDSAAQQTDLVLLTNALSVNSIARPSNYEITTSTPFEWIFSFPGNTPYDPTLIFPGSIYTSKTVSGFYSGYSAQIGRNPENLNGLVFNTNFFGFGAGFFTDTFLLLPDPTNQAGRIEINADVLDLSHTRIRTEGLLSLNAKHLKGTGAIDVSAGIINADLGSTNGSLVISNVFPSHFKRVRGDIFAWSGIWNNVETNNQPDPSGQFPNGYTNNIKFHVLVVDHDLRADFKPTIRNLTLRSTNVVIRDNLSVNRSLRLQTENLTLDGTLTLSGEVSDLRAANLIGVKNVLIESNAVFQVANDALFGYDTTSGYDSIINRGMISATAPFFKATTFENSGSIIADNGGSVIIESRTANLSNGRITADRDIYISSGDLTATNSTITAGGVDQFGGIEPGRLVLTITNFITDFGPGANNVWQVSDGFILTRRPFQGDLLGTEIRTIASGFQEVQHIWAGEDVGPGADGFVNNVALGHLILDIRSPNATLRFTGAGFQNALYVVNLDFNAGPSVDINSSLNNLLTIDDNFRIYFVNSNAGDKLTNAFPGRVIHVDNFASVIGATPLVVKANGLGIITPNLDGKNLEVGATYNMRATAAAGQVFDGWSGGTNAESALLTFKMRRNLILQANFVRNPLDDVKGSYNGLFYDSTNGVRHENSGFVNFKVTKKGLVLGKLISGKSYRFKGSFNNSGHAEILVARGSGKSSLILNLQLDLANGTDQVRGTVSADGWVAGLLGDRAHAGPSVSKDAQFTMVIPGDSNSIAGPQGDGFGTIKADAADGLHFKGVLADGTKFNQRIPVSKNGQIPFYLSLYQGSGSVLSWISLTNDVSSSLQGDASWIKKATLEGIHPSGFTNVTTVIGSSYSPPAAGARVLDIVEGTVTLNGGNLSSAITNDTILGSNNVVTVTTGTNGLSITISLPSGLVNGNFVHPDTKKTTLIKGVVLQQQNKARGFFLGTNQSGAVLLENK